MYYINNLNYVLYGGDKLDFLDIDLDKLKNKKLKYVINKIINDKKFIEYVLAYKDKLLNILNKNSKIVKKKQISIELHETIKNFNENSNIFIPLLLIYNILYVEPKLGAYIRLVVWKIRNDIKKSKKFYTTYKNFLDLHKIYNYDNKILRINDFGGSFNKIFFKNLWKIIKINLPNKLKNELLYYINTNKNIFYNIEDDINDLKKNYVSVKKQTSKILSKIKEYRIHSEMAHFEASKLHGLEKKEFLELAKIFDNKIIILKNKLKLSNNNLNNDNLNIDKDNGINNELMALNFLNMDQNGFSVQNFGLFDIDIY